MLCAVFNGFFAAGERFANCLQAHAFGGVGVQLLDFIICPSLAVASKLFGHRVLSKQAPLSRRCVHRDRFGGQCHTLKKDTPEKV